MPEGERIPLERKATYYIGTKRKSRQFGKTLHRVLESLQKFSWFLGWWRHIHSWYGKQHLKKSGEAPVTLTDREKYVMTKCCFLEGEICHRGAAPLRPHFHTEPTDSQACLSQNPPTLARQVFQRHPTDTLLIANPYYPKWRNWRDLPQVNLFPSPLPVPEDAKKDHYNIFLWQNEDQHIIFLLALLQHWDCAECSKFPRCTSPSLGQAI